MSHKLRNLRGLAALMLACVVAFGAIDADAKGRKGHDVSKKVTKKTNRENPIGYLNPNLERPRTRSASGALARKAVPSGQINFDLSNEKSYAPQHVPQRIAPVEPLRACVTYNFDGRPYGMVEVTADGLVQLRDHELLDAGWGGTNVGSRYYYNTYADEDNGTVWSVEACLWDSQDNWRMIEYNQDGSLDLMAYSMACDPVTETVYGCFISADGQSIEIGTLDPKACKRSGTIGKAEKALYAMGFGSDGTLYGIDSAGTLYSVNKSTGVYTKITDTGLKTTYTTAGSVDSFNDVFYYAICPAGPSDNVAQDWALYSIDLKHDYKVEKFWDLNAELGGMYVANPVAKPAAPAAPVLGDVKFEEGSLSGTVSFTVPSESFDGSALIGPLTYGIIANENVIATGSTTAGAEPTINVTLPKAGMYTIRVYISNPNGISPKSEGVTAWYGNGQPLEPTGVKYDYTLGDKEVTVSWDAVTGSFNDGYIVPENITYTVSRSIQGETPEVIASNLKTTEYSDPVTDPENCRIFRYFVEAVYEGVSSAPVSTDYFTVGVIVPPFAPDFLNPVTAGYFTTVDNKGTDLQWTYSTYYAAMQVFQNFVNSREDVDVELVTAPVQLKGGYAYTISYLTLASSSNNYGVGLQYGTSLSNMQTIIEPENINPNSGVVEQKVEIIPDADGIYYFAVRVLANQVYNVYFNVAEFQISEGLSMLAPNMVTDVTFTPPYDGSKQIEVSFKAPAETINGKKLTNLSKIEVLRDGELVQTFRNPTFGQQISFTDTGKTNADVTYSITAYNNDGPGKTYTGSAHMGVNLPASPVDCTVVQDMSNPGMVTVSWTPVAKDINGNDIDPSLIRYAIFADDYSTVLKQNLTAASPTTTFRAIAANSGQIFAYYLVVPYTEGGTNGYDGGFGITEMIPVGTPYTMPVNESFYRNGSNQLSYSMGQSGSASMSLSAAISSQYLSIGSQDGDGGILSLYCAPNNFADVFTANIDVDDSDDVALSFWYTGVPEMRGYFIQPYVIVDGEKENLCDMINTIDCLEKGWNNAKISLTKYRGKTVQIGWYIFCDMNNFAFGLDNIQIKRFLANDLRAGAVTPPFQIEVGKTNEVVFEIHNDGSDNAPAEYEIELYEDGKLVQTVDGPAVNALSTKAVTFSHKPAPDATGEQELYAVIRWDGDEDDSNNTSEVVSVKVKESSYPAVSDLTAELGDDTKSADVTWTEPDHAPKMYEITESFEDYQPFTLNGFGNWKVYDGDGDNVYGLWGSPFQSDESPKSWMVIDQNEMSRIDYALARTGVRSAATIGAKNGASEDWLISPELPGVAQTVSFFAATAPEDYGPETFKFYYSTTGTDIEDFIQLGDEIEVPEGEWEWDDYWEEDVQVTTWYEYSYDLPEGTKYFAIVYTSDDIWSLMVDDVTFTISDEVINLQGYNLFRNGVQLNDKLLTDTKYHDDFEGMRDGDYSYGIETVYDKGNSGISNIAKVTFSGVDGVQDTSVLVKGEKGAVLVKGAQGKNVTIYNASGLKVYDAQADATLRCEVEAGLYIVNIDGKVVKVMVP